MHEKHEYGWLFATLSELQEGYLVNDTIEVQISVIVLRAFPMVKEDDKCIGPHKFKRYVSRLARYLEVVEWGSTKVGVQAAESKGGEDSTTILEGMHFVSVQTEYSPIS